MPASPDIRLAESKDIIGLMDLLLSFHDDCWFGTTSTNENKILEYIERVMDAGLVVVGVVRDIEEAEHIVASIAVAPQQPWWSDDWFMHDRWFFVNQGYRSMNIARALVSLARSYAKSCEMPLLLMDISGVDVARKPALYRRLGMTLIGGNYVER